jgi:hypothetical protein
MEVITREQLARALGRDELPDQDITFSDPPSRDQTFRADRDVMAAPHELLCDDRFATLRVKLFAAGYVPLRASLSDADGPRLWTIYIRSSRLLAPRLAGVPPTIDRTVTISRMRGRFANHLWQYLFLHLYGLRSAARIEITNWDGHEMIAADDARPQPGRFPTLEYGPGETGDLALWQHDDPPVNVDFFGYFQNVLPCWRPHGDYVRRLFALRDDWGSAVAETMRRMEGRTLIAIHIRRGDYLTYDPVQRPIFRTVPVEWYRRKLLQLWPGAQRPILHIATDEPSLRKDFADFETVPASTLAPMTGMPEHIRDFCLLRQSAIMLACNSSFSTMAALLADESQHCYLPNFSTSDFDPYRPWSEVRFWDRFSSPPTTQSAAPACGRDPAIAGDPATGAGPRGWDRIRSLFATWRRRK